MRSEKFASRLASLMPPGMSERAFAREIGISIGGLRGLLHEGNSPNLDTLMAIAETRGVSVSWLATGEAEKAQNPQIPDPCFSGVPEMFRTGDDFAMVPRLEVQASAGPGSLVEHEDAIDFMAFQATWLRRKGIDPTAARALTVRGDSMEPTIRSGDVLLVDTSKRRVEDNGIYVVVSGGYVLVKRVHPRRDGSMMLISDNQAYPPEDVPSHEATDFSVAGRVMWFGRSI